MAGCKGRRDGKLGCLIFKYRGARLKGQKGNSRGQLVGIRLVWGSWQESCAVIYIISPLRLLHLKCLFV